MQMKSKELHAHPIPNPTSQPCKRNPKMICSKGIYIQEEAEEVLPRLTRLERSAKPSPRKEKTPCYASCYMQTGFFKVP